MAREPEVILHEMQETRSDLAEKLDTLEKEVVDTVHGATEAVTGTVENVKEAVEETVGNVKATVEETVESIRETFDIQCQTRRHPWAMLGGSLAVGYLIGGLVQRATAEFPERSTNRPAFPEPAYEQKPSEDGSGGWTAGLLDAVGPELQRLKGLAIGMALGALRDVVVEALPKQVQEQVGDAMDRVTSKLGGDPVHGDETSSRAGTHSPEF